MEALVESILQSMSNVKKPQQTFLKALFAVLVVFQGRATFRNMSRYTDMSEKRFSRWYRRSFDFVEFTVLLLLQSLPKDSIKIAAIDASFINKSRQSTDGLGWFYNGVAGEAQRGLEASVVCVVDLKANTAYALDARQTIDEEYKTRVDLYAEQVVSLSPQLQKLGIRHVAADAYYSKVKFVSRVTEAGLDIVGKLRVDAQLKWLYEGEYKGRGRPRKFDGKVDFINDLERFQLVGALNDETQVYAAVVHSTHLKRAIRVVMLRWKKKGKIGTALLYSTDTTLDAITLVAYYKARFQIEFLFREAKQHTGLTHCQSPRKEAIHTHINASLIALTLLKLEDRSKKQVDTETVISMTSWKRRKFNQHLMIRLFDTLGLSLKRIKITHAYELMCDYGAIVS